VPEQRTDEERKAALTKRVVSFTRKGWRVETRSDYQVTLVRGHRPNHLLHLLLTVLTVGLWAIVWICLAIFGGEKRIVVTAE
jgi:hypothetical protein